MSGSTTIVAIAGLLVSITDLLVRVLPLVSDGVNRRAVELARCRHRSLPGRVEDDDQLRVA